MEKPLNKLDTYKSYLAAHFRSKTNAENNYISKFFFQEFDVGFDLLVSFCNLSLASLHELVGHDNILWMGMDLGQVYFRLLDFFTLLALLKLHIS